MTNAEPHGFRRWRRTRPFWGGVFAVLGGIELIAIPLAPMPVTIHQGMAGVASWLIGALLVVAGALLWFQPAQRSFFGILAVLLSLASFLTSNFGGFLLGMILGLVGGAIGFAWTPVARRTEPEAPEDRRVAPVDDRTRVHGYVLDPKPAPLPPAPQAVPPSFGNGAQGPQGGARHRKMMAFAVPALLPAVLGVQFLAPTPSPETTPAPSTSASAAPTAEPAPSGSASPAPSASGDTEKPGKTGEKCPEIPKDTSGLSQAEAGKLLERLKDAEDPQACLGDGRAGSAAGGFTTYGEHGTLRASSLTMSGLSYDGVAELDSAKGTVRALKFTMSKAVLKDVDQTSGRTALKTPSLTLDDGVVMYTTKMSSKLLGIPLVFTPEHPPPLTLPFMVMTDVVSERPAVRAGGATIDALGITA
ncbi:DUF6114 domain-containing protein [Spirillospora sp. NPDC047279]|uniref:DUF6114 domain-containing protein n=1 Tax=Spirillospora sp. NPDC047279 TaxID=3155478 RepID=UPI0033C11E91